MKQFLKDVASGLSVSGVMILLIEANNWGYRGEAYKHWQFWACLGLLFVIGGRNKLGESE